MSHHYSGPSQSLNGSQSAGDGMTHVTLQPTQHETLPDDQGNIAGEVPPAIAEQIMQMITEFKKSGQIPKDADDHQLMTTMHNEMMKERETMVQAMNMSNPALRHAQMLQAPSTGPSQTKGQVSIPMMAHNHGNQPQDAGTEDLSVIVANTINQNISAINDKDTDGDTLLHRVCSAGQQQLAQALLASGAHCDSVNNLGQTPLLLAATAGQILIIQLLIERGADVSFRDSAGWTALHHAASGNVFLSPATIHYLTECCGLNFSSLTNDGQTVFHLIANKKKENNREILPILLSRPELDIGLVDISGNSAMHYAAEQCQPHMVYLFGCSGGAKLLLTTNRAGKTPLDIAKNLPTLEGFIMYQEMEAWILKGQNYKPSDTTPSVFYRRLFVAPVVFVIFLVLSRVLTPEWQGFLSVAGLCIYLILAFNTRARINHISRLPDPSRLSVFCTGYVGTTYVLIGYYGMTDWPHYSQKVAVLLLYLCLIVIGVLYYRLVRADPGFTCESKMNEAGVCYTMRDLVSTFKRPSVWCPPCQLIPTKPTKHCKLCNRCVYKMDHHCMYTMRCVGYKNHYIFIWFTIVLVFGQSLTFAVFPGYMELMGYYNPQAYDFSHVFLHIFRYEGLLLVEFLGQAAVLGMTVPLLYISLNNISNGYTAYFNPRLIDKSRHVSALSARERLGNIVSFLATGKVKKIDPSFVM